MHSVFKPFFVKFLLSWIMKDSRKRKVFSEKQKKRSANCTTQHEFSCFYSPVNVIHFARMILSICDLMEKITGH